MNDIAPLPTAPEAGTDAPVRGRSLGALAFARLRRNKAAMASLLVLTLVALFCFAGPLFNPHGYATIYPSYVAVPPSLAPYPHADSLAPVMKAAVERGRARLDSFAVDGAAYRAVISADKPIDPRIVRYLDRPDEFDGATIGETRNDGRTAVVTGRVNGEYFLFGTDRNGRDMLARIMVGGQC
jgi:oligopeptide transport system permease protein